MTRTNDTLPLYAAMIVLIDNYDSFTYNLVQKLGEVGPKHEIQVFRNDKVTVAQIEDLRADARRHLPRPLHPQRRRHQQRT